MFNDVYQQEDPRHAATDAMRSLLALARGGGRAQFGASPEPFPAADLPPAPDLRRVRVHRARRRRRCRLPSSRALSPTSGFAHVGQHRSKPVQLWEQGRARILLNLAPQRSITPATASICALAVESSDPGRRRCDELIGCWHRSLPGLAAPMRPI